MGRAARSRTEVKKRWIITIKLTSNLGTKPIVKNLMGDTIFCALSEGQSASWIMRRDPRDRRKA